MSRNGPLLGLLCTSLWACSGGGETVADAAAVAPDGSGKDATDTTVADASGNTGPACSVQPTLNSLANDYFAGSCTFAKCHAPPSPAGEIGRAHV